ncbi:MAG: 2Fe-2S iron-sulfur cluster-binding protein [Woeseiaceae bacterium]
MNRLPRGGRIDRGRTLNFRFDGRKLHGYAGDTLASALLANDIAIVGRSFKLHRPRGIVGKGAEEPNAILQVGEGGLAEPNVRATQVELYDGLVARTTKGWPGVRFDLGAINGLLSKGLSAGFYYKTFMRPRSMWKFYERLIRASAGFGWAPQQADPDAYEHVNSHCDVLVVGGGPAGLMAALAAARSGARVILADEQNEFGGSLLESCDRIDEMSGTDWVAKTVDVLDGLKNVTLLPRSTVFGYYDHNFLAIAERCTDHLLTLNRTVVPQRLWRVRARQVVLAQGAFERPLVFDNNDRPGVLLASAVSAYIHRYAVRPGKRAVVFTNNDSAYRTALDLLQAGASVVVIDSRVDGQGTLRSGAESAGITVLTGHVVSDTIGRRRIRGVRVAGYPGTGDAAVKSNIRIDCDLLAVSGGWSPAVHLHSQAGGRNLWDEGLQAFVPESSVASCVSAGAANGRLSLDACLKDGHGAGVLVATRCGYDAPVVDVPTSDSCEDYGLQPLWRVPGERGPERCSRQFIDFKMIRRWPICGSRFARGIDTSNM